MGGDRYRLLPLGTGFGSGAGGRLAKRRRRQQCRQPCSADVVFCLCRFGRLSSWFVDGLHERIVYSAFYGQEQHYILSSTPKPVEPRVLQYHFKKYIASCKIADANFHALRHTFATRCVEAGFEIRSLSEILGHSSTRITLECYVHSSMNLKRKNMEKLKIADTVEKEFPGA